MRLLLFLSMMAGTPSAPPSGGMGPATPVYGGYALEHVEGPCDRCATGAGLRRAGRVRSALRFRVRARLRA
jgi:hypothetical protein